MISHHSVTMSLCSRLLFGVAMCLFVAITAALASEPPTKAIQFYGKTAKPRKATAVRRILL